MNGCIVAVSVFSLVMNKDALASRVMYLHIFIIMTAMWYESCACVCVYLYDWVDVCCI